MKKFLTKVFCGLVCLATMVFGMTAFAADTMEMEWRGDYSDNSDPKLIVTFTPSAPYMQQVTTVIYPASDTTPTFAEYLRMKEVTVDGIAETEQIFSITNEFTETDGAYTVALQSNGYMQSQSLADETVYVISPNRIQTILGEFANATSANVETVFDKVMGPLQLEDEENAAVKTKKMNILLSMKDSFGTLEDVRNAWRSADVIVYIGESTSTAEGVAQRLIANADVLGINIEDADFRRYVDEDPLADDEGDETPDSNELCVALLANGSGIESVSELQNLISGQLGLFTINDASEDLVDDAFNKYKAYLGIPSTTMTAYNNLSEGNQGKALRAIYNKNFANLSLLAEAFTTAVNTLSAGGDTGDTPIIIVPGTNGGGGTGGASISAPPTSGVPEVPPTSTTAGFKDVPSTHWAYPYITELASKGIINGYDDNTFRPGNNVTREEFVKMIIGATGMLQADAKCSFTDVPENVWYYEYVASAYTKEIVQGVTDTEFGVGTNITRQDVAVIAARILTRLTGKTPDVEESTLTDFATVSDYAQDSVKILNGMGIINGFDDGSFKPHNALTRAEAATIICKLIENL